MGEPKPIASLSSGLLARKGAARPAMRRQGLNGPGHNAMPQDDLGWNDMGYGAGQDGSYEASFDVDPPQDALPDGPYGPKHSTLLAGAIPDTVVPDEVTAAPEPEVARQQADIAARMLTPEPEAPPVAVEAPVATAVTDEQPLADTSFDDVAAMPSVLSVKPGKTRSAAPVAAPVVAAPVLEAVVAAAKSAPSVRRAAFTLRLDAGRHLKLRLASAVTGQSAQLLLTAALDDLLTKIPEIEDLAGRVSRPSEG
ncbi:hypothetical protein [Blastomonas sp.]|uniref:hypothetical protein n=1 Tax=Blastomonas sp. TaxID=1909299 RepID=UPI00359446DC